MHFHEKVEEKPEEKLLELPGDFIRQDTNEDNNNAQFAMLIDLMKDQNKNFMQMIQTTN